jgi:antitoxin (DNA-binding transcriptional repressor) of toxin-antitoxin stability system
MEFVPYRMLRNQPAELRRKLAEKGELIVTVDGEPFAIMLPVNKESLEELILLVTQVQAQLAAAGIRQGARKRGLGQMTAEEAQVYVAETRKSRRAKRSG